MAGASLQPLPAFSFSFMGSILKHAEQLFCEVSLNSVWQFAPDKAFESCIIGQGCHWLMCIHLSTSFHEAHGKDCPIAVGLTDHFLLGCSLRTSSSFSGTNAHFLGRYFLRMDTHKPVSILVLWKPLPTCHNIDNPCPNQLLQLWLLVCDLRISFFVYHYSFGFLSCLSG